MSLNPFRTKLLAISNCITQRELSELKFVCKEHIPDGILEQITRPLDLFARLEQQNLLAADNQDFLGILLTGIGRHELRDKLFEDADKPSVDDQKLTSMRKSLCDHYTNVLGWLQPLTWNSSFRIHIKHIYTNLEIVTEVQQGTVIKREPLRSYSDIFMPKFPLNIQPRRILVEGQAGVGKSTFAAKLSHDWASGKEYLASFDVVCLLELKQVKGSLKRAVFEQLFPRDFAQNEDEVFKLLTAVQERVLLILDGFDELSAAHSQEVLDLFSRKLLRNATVVLTSRPVKGDKIYKFADTRLQIVGFNTGNIHQFITRYFQEDPAHAESLIKELELHPVTEDVAKIPLTAMLLCALWEEMPHGALQSTVSGLFTELVLCLLKRYYTKNVRKEDPLDVELITSLEDLPKDVMSSLLSLGELALYGLFDDKLIFDLKDVSKCCANENVLELGFLSKQSSASKLKPSRKCRFVHKSFQEFFASLWLSDKIKSAFIDDNEFEEVSAIVMRCLAADIEGNILFGFVSGLLGDRCKPFMELLISEGSLNVKDNESKNNLFEVSMFSLFESQQGNLAYLIESLVPDGKVVVNARNVTAYGVRSLVFFLQHSTVVKTLAMKQCSIDSGTISIIAGALHKLRNVTEMVIENNAVGNEGVQAFSTSLKQPLALERLTFSGNYVGEESAKYFAHILEYCPELLYLDFSCNGFGDEGMKLIFNKLKCLPYLRELHVAGNKITSEAVVPLCDNLRYVPKLVHLSLGYQSGIGAKGIQVLAGDLPLKVPCLQVLNLQHVNVTDCHCEETSEVIYGSLGKSIENLQDFKSLDLSGNYLYVGAHVGECVRYATRLVYLNLSENGFGDEGIKNLAQYLPHLTVLQELFLARNRITCNGISFLMDGIRGISTLRVLSLARNRIADKGLEKLALTLPHLSDLEKLLLCYNLVTERGIKELACTLPTVPQMKFLSIKGNAVSEEGFVCFVKVLDALPNLKTLMVSAPVKWQEVAKTEGRSTPAVCSKTKQMSPTSEHDGCNMTEFSLTREQWFCSAPEGNRYYTRFSRDTFDLLMDAANAHPNLQEMSFNQNGIPKCVDAVGSDRYRKLKIEAHSK